ncbi:CLUMA_CG013950, isoform A [Clunio marinus]|uniref:CLUMA_CG013950, isoform A n=1 Tax=Clunio marinus TaxID=568069 RepID=A0A1J1IKD3_9DIPT|nr:CLUMA_CG013950, isoform A [Clunio marinus]
MEKFDFKLKKIIGMVMERTQLRSQNEDEDDIKKCVEAIKFREMLLSLANKNIFTQGRLENALARSDIKLMEIKPDTSNIKHSHQPNAASHTDRSLISDHDCCACDLLGIHLMVSTKIKQNELFVKDDHEPPFEFFLLNLFCFPSIKHFDKSQDNEKCCDGIFFKCQMKLWNFLCEIQRKTLMLSYSTVTRSLHTLMQCLQMLSNE